MKNNSVLTILRSFLSSSLWIKIPLIYSFFMDKNHPYVQFLKQWNERCKGKIDIYIQTIRNNRMQKLKADKR